MLTFLPNFAQFLLNSGQLVVLWVRTASADLIGVTEVGGSVTKVKILMKRISSSPNVPLSLTTCEASNIQVQKGQNIESELLKKYV